MDDNTKPIITQPLISKTLLDEMGVAMSDDDVTSLSEHFETTLNERVINEIVEELDTEQLEQLVAMQQASDQELVAWLKHNAPEFKEIIEDETAILLGELAEHADTL